MVSTNLVARLDKSWATRDVRHSPLSSNKVARQSCSTLLRVWHVPNFFNNVGKALVCRERKVHNVVTAFSLAWQHVRRHNSYKQAELVDRRSSELVVKSQYKMSSSDVDGRRRLIQICLIVFVVINSHLSVAVGTSHIEFRCSLLASGLGFSTRPGFLVLLRHCMLLVFNLQSAL